MYEIALSMGVQKPGFFTKIHRLQRTDSVKNPVSLVGIRYFSYRGFVCGCDRIFHRVAEPLRSEFPTLEPRF